MSVKNNSGQTRLTSRDRINELNKRFKLDIENESRRNLIHYISNLTASADQVEKNRNEYRAEVIRLRKENEDKIDNVAGLSIFKFLRWRKFRRGEKIQRKNIDKNKD